MLDARLFGNPHACNLTGVRAKNIDRLAFATVVELPRVARLMARLTLIGRLYLCRCRLCSVLIPTQAVDILPNSHNRGCGLC